MDNEERGDLVKNTINSRGWKEVIQPALDERKASLITNILNNAKTHFDFIAFQQAINAIDNLILFIETVINDKNTPSE